MGMTMTALPLPDTTRKLNSVTNTEIKECDDIMSETHLFINGNIFTSDDENLRTDSMLVRDGRILWTGLRTELPDFDGPVTDLKGKCVIPGFVDAHMHPVMLADFRKKNHHYASRHPFHPGSAGGHPRQTEGTGPRTVDRGMGIR